MTLRCASWCGGGCTEEQYQRAVRQAEALARRLGEGWKPHVWENLGWHFSVVSPCGRLKVHHGGTRVKTYTAFLGRADFPGGRWAEHGKTPEAAIKAVVAVGKREAARVANLVAGL